MDINNNLDEQLLPVYKQFFYNQQYFAILYGGRGSGKSRVIAQKIMYRILTERNHIWVIVRAKMTDHINSTYRELLTVIESFGVEGICDCLKAPMTIRIPACKSEILFLGLDDPQRLKGLSGVTGIWWEEISEVRNEEMFDEVMSGFRPDKGHYEQVLMSFNPRYRDHWIKERFFPDNDEYPDKHRTFKLKTTWEHNDKLNKNTVQSYHNLKHINYNLYRVNTLGEWGTEQQGREFYKKFDGTIHVDSLNRCQYNHGLPLHISFDFNVLPHVTMMVFQIYYFNNTSEVRVIDELVAKNPHNSTHGMCNLFIEKYGNGVDSSGKAGLNHQDALFIYGDPSGKARSTNSSEFESNVHRIINDLRNFHLVNRFAKSAPSVAVRGQWINLIFEQQLHNISVLVNPTCKGLLLDFTEMQEDENGGKVKEKVHTRQGSYEKYGHWSDAFDYFMTQAFDRDWKTFSHKNTGLSHITVVTRNPPKYRY